MLGVVAGLRGRDLLGPQGDPGDDLAEALDRLATQRSEGVRDLGRRGRPDGALEEPVAGEDLQILDEHLLADALDPVAEPVEAQRPVLERDEHQDAPPAGDVVEHGPRRAVAVEYVTVAFGDLETVVHVGSIPSSQYLLKVSFQLNLAV